jgi:peptidoglycan/LPS O-acetylase OafA/YrhL
MHKTSPIPGLTAMRLLAAIAVIIGHVEWLKAAFHLPGLWNNFNDIFTGPPISYILQEKIHWLSPFMSRLGLYAVVFFFVLSGFLITHVLIQETQTKGRFSISSFYWRRIIRIWPLYLMIVFLAFGLDAINWPIFHYPNQAEWQTQSHLVKMCYFLFSPNLALLLVPAAGMVGHLWSIGVEEHFYLFWPWLLRKIKSNKNRILTFGACWILAKIILKLLITTYQVPLHSLALYFIFNKFECMALGGYLAFVFNDKLSDTRDWIFRHLHSLIYANMLVLLLVTYCLPDAWSNHNYLLVATLSGLLIFKASKTNPAHPLNHPLVCKLGYASYAIYIVHFPILLWVFNSPLLHKNKTPNISENLLLYTASLLISIILGLALHRWVEIPIKNYCLKNNKKREAQ